MAHISKRSDIPKPVQAEQQILDTVRQHIAKAGGRRSLGMDYDQELIALRDALAEAKPEDIPPLVEQMTRLQALAAQRGRGEDIPVDPACPYFGHLALEEAGDTRHVLLGKHTYLAPDDDIRIVDWRHAPVSRIYYSYDEGDDYEESFGGKNRQGTVQARRSVTILDGDLRRIADSENIYVNRKGTWHSLDPEASRLSGGQGTSTRAEGLSPVRGVLGVDADGTDRKDKHLPEIAALLDRQQFDLISSPAANLLVVKGGAGSGKTTVGLHRIAYLTFADERRFRPNRILVVVLNQALASYISRVLPALGVEGVRAMTFDDWARNQRRRHIKGLPMRHSRQTPHAVSRLKRHAAMIPILDDLVDQQDEALTRTLLKAVSGTADADRVGAAWQALGRLPLDIRRSMMQRWVKGKLTLRKVSNAPLDPRTAAIAESKLIKMERQTADVVSDWADLFTDKTALEQAFDTHAPSEFSEQDIEQVFDWCVQLYNGLEPGPGDDPPVIDREDEAIFLRLYQLKRGWLKGPGGRLLYDHLMLDEVQDFSHLEVAVLMHAVESKTPVTLAGDTAQQLDQDSGFVSWDELLADLGVKNSRIVPLEVAYRSTAEIMTFSRDLLGDIAEPPSKTVRHGAPIELHRFSGPGQAVGFLGSALRDLARREPMANVAVVARHPAMAQTYYDGLIKAEVPRLNLVLAQDFTFSPGVEVTEIRQAKGLEFDYVVLVDVNRDSYPDNAESRHLLHVGATRAAHQLWIFVTGRPSPVLPEWIFENEN